MDEAEKKRVCRPCGVEKLLTEFNRDSSEWGGYRYYCKACAKEKKRIYSLKEKGMNLNQAKFNSIFNGLSAIVRKTYESVPINSAWDAQQIHSDLIRSSIASDLRTTIGCLNNLVSAGLISEPTRGTFIRIPVKQKIVGEKAMPVTPVEKTPLDVLTGLAVTAKKIGEMVQKLSADIEEAALQVQIELETESEDTQKLKQLQQILKSLG